MIWFGAAPTESNTCDMTPQNSKLRSPIESIRSKLREAAAASGMSKQEIGEAMGYSSGGARQAVSRLLNPNASHDPKLSTLLSFADAIKRPLREIL
jgi:transcriptional regulator with XRE-family HTH domain